MLINKSKAHFIIFLFSCQLLLSPAIAGDKSAVEEAEAQLKEITEEKINENELIAIGISLNNENNYVPLEDTIDKVTFKLLRGATNVLTASGEIPRQLILSAMNDHFLLVLPLGLSRGIALTVVRSVTGLVDTLFFYCSPDGSYDSYLNPHFVWQPAQSNPRKQYPPLD